ncbi:MAG: MBL fold metallo-hydrolase [Dehalococcoidia bacterium]|nr:MBL fold metallo-hydrolase [Dehalococcoidia bacterium]
MTTPLSPARIVLGDNNVWALRLADARDGRGWLLIDAGVEADRDAEVDAWAMTLEQARAHGFAPREVRAVIVTHEHIDHAALAYRWAAEGARIVVGRAGTQAVVAGRTGLDAQRALRLHEYERHGCPADVLERLATWRGARGATWEPCPRDAIDAADEHETWALADGRTLRLIAAPGHTPGNLVAWCEKERALFSGDTLLPTTIPTPGLHFPGAVTGDLAARRWPSLPPFLRSVAAVRVLAPAVVYPGHGEVMHDPLVYLDRFDAHHDRRARQVRRHLAAHGASTAFEVTRALFARLPAERLGQAMAEVIGHFDLLLERGEATALVADTAAMRLQLEATHPGSQA